MGRNLVSATARVRPMRRALMKLLPNDLLLLSSFPLSASRSAASARTERANAHLLSISSRETTLPTT